MERARAAADPALVAHVVTSTGLSAAEATRVIGDVVAFHAESVEAYVRRRHGELHGRGGRNAEIFTRLASEVSGRLVSAPVLTERQLRRIVYG